MSIRRRIGVLTGAAVLTGGLAAGVTAALPTVANATSCTIAVPLASCTSGGTVTLTSGGLNIDTPSALAWSTTLNGAEQTMYDTTAGTTGTYTSHTAFYVLDYRGLLSGAGSGWNVTAQATTFTGSSSDTIPDDVGGKVLSIGGGTLSSSANVPTVQCEVALTCGTITAPTTFTYPLFIPTGTSLTPVKIYDAVAGTGSGLVQVGSGFDTGANPAVWAVTIPAVLALDTYTSTITLSVSSGP
jgi:hypothetical protein